ncbi:MAG: bifunctional tetrahydrofolate synthase/dihydrofolate synthase [Methylotenera sp.]|nr:MAG: bifunctional tetrahydrofolate synthase/dihydrofolate synthase [Methylotenera sp.]
MTNSTLKPTTALQWLAYIEALHPKSIAMGLDRVSAVASRLQLNPSFPIITVAGTNGKGSTCAMLSQIYTEAGFSVGCYTSPHLMRYNERVRINQQEISDTDLCLAFDAVETARGNIPLTYFEMGTLATMWHFCQSKLDVVVLEVGLGGRLDAVNIFEPACSIVTTIDLDHMEYLGDTREKIGFEKAGIFRPNVLAICGDENTPNTLIDYAKLIDAPLKLINRDFHVKKLMNGWQFTEAGNDFLLPNLGLQGEFQRNNAACAVCAVQYLTSILPVKIAHIQSALQAVTLIGRFYSIDSNPRIIVDVAHNPHAALSLAHNLKTTPCSGKTIAVFAMLADKDINGVIQAVLPYIDAWLIADNHSIRGAKAQELHGKLTQHQASAQVDLFSNVASALAAACVIATKNDRIIVFGSFYTVADAIDYIANKKIESSID